MRLPTMVTTLHSPILKEKFPNRSSIGQDQLVNFPTSNQDTGNSFEDVSPAGQSHWATAVTARASIEDVHLGQALFDN